MKNRIVHVRCIFRRGTSDDERAFNIAGHWGIAPARCCSDRGLHPLPQPEPDALVHGYLSGVHVDDTRDGRMRVYLPDGELHTVEHEWVRMTPTPAEVAAHRLRGIADGYREADAQPDEHKLDALGCWAISEVLGGVADEIERGGVTRDVPTAGELAARKLRAIADLYQMPDGQPGERGYGCWGWRTIAEELRRVAAEIERGS